jgi:hypothetical protein
MWEKDRKLLKAYRECYDNMRTSLLAGEEVDVSSTCVQETEALCAYTINVIDAWKSKHPQELSEKKARFYTPKMPYFQNL